MLTFCNTRFGDIHAELTMVDCFQQFSKATPIVTVHLKIESNLFLRKIGQVHGIELLLKRTIWNGGHDKVLGLIMESVEKVNYLPQRSFVSYGSIAIAAVNLRLLNIPGKIEHLHRVS